MQHNPIVMTEPGTSRNDPRADRLLAPVRRLRGALKKWTAVTGGARVALVLAALVVVSFGLDRIFRMDRSQRLVCLIIGLAVLARVAWKHLAQPLMRLLSDKTLALRLERRFPVLRTHMLTALEFSRAGEAIGAGASPVLADAAVEEGVRRVGKAPKESVVQWSGATRLGVIAAAVLVVLAALAVANPETARLWLLRNVFLADVNWPFRTHLQVEGVVDGVLRIPEGGDSVLRVRVSGEAPDRVYFEHKAANLREQMPMSSDNLYRRTLQDVREEFAFRISGGDNTTSWIRVELLPRPVVAEIRLEAAPPAYTRLAPLVFDGSQDVCEIPAASRVLLTGRASASLKDAWVEHEGERRAALEVDGAAFTLPIEGESLRNGDYNVFLRDTLDVESAGPTTLAVRVVPDAPPEVKATLDGVGRLILARARIPVKAEVSDDYGVGKVALNWKKTLADGSDAGEGSNPVALPSGDGNPPRTWTGRVVLDLQDADPLQAGGHVRLGVAAWDGNDVSGPGTGESTLVDLRIVEEQELKADLIRREQSFRRQFTERIQEQRRLLEDSRVALAGGSEAVGAYPGLVRSEVAVREALPAIRLAFASLREEILNNRIEDEKGTDAVRLNDRIAGPILKLEEELLPLAIARLEDAAASTKPEEKRAFLAQAIALEQKALEDMRAIRSQMVASDGLKQAVDHLRDVLRRQLEINRATETEREKAIEGLFED